MRVALALLVCTLAAFAADTPAPRVPCLTAAATDCGVPASDMKQARKLYQRGAKLKAADHDEEALDYFERASRLVPRNVEFATAREMTRQALVYGHIRRGNDLLAAERRIQAAAEFRAAAAIDPDNTFAAQRMSDAMPASIAQLSPGLQRVERSTEIHVQPAPGRHDFHVRGDVRSLYTALGTTFGLTFQFDDSLPAVRVRFDVGDADYADALAAAERATRTFTVPLDTNRLRVLADNQNNRNQYEWQVMQTYYVSPATTPAQLNDYVNVLRTIFELQRISISANSNAIVVRGPQRIVDLASRFIEQTQQGPAQVMLDVQLYEVSHTALRQLGITLPLQFQMFDLSAALAALAAGGNQSLVDQLISSGGINQANSQAIQALLAQLQNQQNSILKTPFATFGGGLTHYGVAIPPGTASFSFNSTDLRTLEHLTIRAEQGKAADVRIGIRYPILNATFAPIFNSAALSQVIGNNSFIAPFPSFNYQDLGLTVKATPSIHRTDDVSLKLELQLQSLGGQSFNGIPTISNRQYTGDITIRNGESAVLAGMISAQDLASMTGVPGFSRIPVLGLLGSAKSDQRTDSELLMTITAHVLKSPAALGQTLMYAR
jgi:tetratricopeptide (TPR) repeat protein